MEEKKDGWIRYPAEKEEYDRIRDDIMDAADAAEMSPRQQIRLELGMEEMLVNIIAYAYDHSGIVWVRAAPAGNLFRLEFADHGKAFDPLARDMRPTDGIPEADQEEGGYGIYLVKKNFSSVAYVREELFGQPANHLTLELSLS
ncbi:MAG: ATP-binding protein [Selenomonadaceae bacterium]|nr:ATP-binding protein [Selenomonadaceae bacterium]